MGNVRKRLYPSEVEFLGLDWKEPKDGRSQARYTITQKQWERVKANFRVKHSGIQEHTKQSNIPFNCVRQYWDKSNPDYSILVRNEDFGFEDIEEKFDLLLEKYKDTKPRKAPKLKAKPKAIKVITTDDHLGLEPNPNNNALFNYEYNAGIYKHSYDKVFESVIKEYNTHGTFEELILENLGDEQDGWNGKTTRGGHDLPQNMTNAEVFETCVDVKVDFIQRLVNSKVAKKITLLKVVNDNHSGDFGHTINIATKKMINLLYKDDFVQVETLTKFLEHRTYGDHCFILTHGKDRSQMFKGLPLQLNDKTINYINDYIRHYNITSKYIHVEKGDLHQLGYNKCSTFDYRNFMSFAPPSSWVQHNFGDCYSGYSIQVVPKWSNEISHTDYFLDYQKIN